MLLINLQFRHDNDIRSIKFIFSRPHARPTKLRELAKQIIPFMEGRSKNNNGGFNHKGELGLIFNDNRSLRLRVTQSIVVGNNYAAHLIIPF